MSAVKINTKREKLLFFGLYAPEEGGVEGNEKIVRKKFGVVFKLFENFNPHFTKASCFVYSK
jgi:hypothetical protein